MTPSKGREINQVNNIPLKYLEKIETISALKVLVCFFQKEERTVKYSISELSSDTGMAANSVRTGLKELVKIGYIKETKEKSKDRSRIYEVVLKIEPSIVDSSEMNSSKNEPSAIEPSKSDTLEWETATAARKKKTEEEPEVNNIIIDYDNINYYTEDINSVSIVNPNIYLSDKQLGQIANRIVRDKFAPRVSGTRHNSWFPQQMKLTKDLLVEWRTEQILAAIEYWTVFSPPPNGVMSMRFFMLKDRSGRSKMLEALDHFKADYLEHFAHEDAKFKIEQKQQEAARKAEEEKKRADKEKEEAANMSDDEFLKSLLGESYKK